MRHQAARSSCPCKILAVSQQVPVGCSLKYSREKKQPKTKLLILLLLQFKKLEKPDKISIFRLVPKLYFCWTIFFVLCHLPKYPAYIIFPFLFLQKKVKLFLWAVMSTHSLVTWVRKRDKKIIGYKKIVPLGNWANKKIPGLFPYLSSSTPETNFFSPAIISCGKFGRKVSKGTVNHCHLTRRGAGEVGGGEKNITIHRIPI